METVTISKQEFQALLAAKHELEDIQAYDKAMADHSESVPHDYVKRLVNGEAPLRVFREWRGLTQSALAEKSGVNRVQITNIEAGIKSGSVATLKKLADALNITLDDMI
jgi:mRNA interferase RelE/StbE